MTRVGNIGRVAALAGLLVIGFAGQGIASPYTDLVQFDPGLVSYWNFEDAVVADGAVAADSTFANSGTYTSFLGPAMGVPGIDAILGSQAVSLYGAGYVDIPNEANFDFTGPFSVEAWVQVDTFSTSWQAIVTKGDNSWRVHRSGGSDNVAFGTSGVGGVAAVDVTNTNVNINNGNWHHVVASFDTATSQRTLYVDGIPTTETFTGGLSLGDFPVQIGANAQTTPNRAWNGLIDDVSIYNRALTAADVANRLALAGGGDQPGSPIPPPPGPPELDPEPNTPVTPDYNWYAFQDPNTGTWNAYEIRGLGDRYGGTLSMYDALLEARTREFNGVQGDLASVGSQSENDFLHRVVNNENAWIGLTDDPNFGTSEGNYVWTNGDPVIYTNWGGGEPNDAGAGEDAAHIRGDGMWNDHQSGIPGSGQSGSPSYLYAIEYQTNAATLQDLQAMGLFPAPAPILPGTPSSTEFDIREVDPAGQLNSVADARSLLTSGGGTITDYNSDVVNFLDGGGAGNFANDAPFQNSGDDYALLARRRINIAQDGDYTFGFNTDDGGELILRDTGGNIVPFELHAGRGGAIVSTYGSLVFDGIAPPGDSLGRVNLAAGNYDLELVFFERAGGAEVELFMGQGDFTGFDSSMFLIGLEPPPPPAAVVQFLDNGSGQFNAYQTVTAGATWDEARVDSAARTFMGQTGHLATIQNQAENDSVDAAAPDNAWIGLTDSDQTSTIDGATMPGTEGNFVWITGEPVPYTNWGGGEPNNAGALGEDAAHMRADGMWNDHNAGSSLGQSDQAYGYVVEYDTALAVSADQLPAWRVEDIRGTATTPDNSNFVDLARNPDGSPTIVEGLFNVINFGDGGGEDQYGGGAPFLQGGGDNFLMRATTFVKVPEDGLYTFNGAHDDPVNVVIGTKFGDVEITDTSCCGSNPATVFLTEGVYPIELTWAEFGGGEHVELGIGLGALANLDPAFALLGAENHPGGLMINLDPDLLGGLTPIPPQAPRGWNVLVQNASQSPGFDAAPPGDGDNLVDNIGEAEQLLAAGGPPEATDTPDVIDYPTFPAGTDADDFALEATGYIDVIDSSGTESLFFYADSDDGFRLEVDGVTVAEFLDPTGSSNTISGEVTVSDDDFIRLVMFERGGGEFVNLSRDMDGDIGTTGDRFLLGDPSSGIIIRQEPGGAGAVIPEPSTWSLLVLGGLGLLLWRRKRA